MKSPFKLYWVETPSAEENCFVAASTNAAAAKYEEDGTGFDRGGCSAKLIRSLDPTWIKKYRGNEASSNVTWPFYVQAEDVHELNVKWRIIEGDDVFEYNGQEYVKQGDLNYVASLGSSPRAW